MPAECFFLKMWLADNLQDATDCGGLRNSNDERGPNANEDKDQSNNESNTSKNDDLNKEYSKETSNEGGNKRNEDNTKSTKEKTRIGKLFESFADLFEGIPHPTC